MSVNEVAFQNYLKAEFAKGYAAGLEAAAKWHEDLVKFMEEDPVCDSTQNRARLHRKCAKAIRALGKEGP